MTPPKTRVLLAASLALALVGSGCAQLNELVQLPRLQAADVKPALRPQTSTIFDANGKVITTFHGAENRTVVPLDRIRDHTVKAVVAIEDQRFYEHDGVDLRGIARAAVENLKSGGVTQGGSTITQQFVKNRILAGEDGVAERSLERKIREAALARQVEEKLTKQEILERYLNTVYFGNGAYGIQAAAKTYFGRPSKRLTLRQSALLAGLLKAPQSFDPYDRRKRAARRMRVVLRKMEQSDFISSQRRQKAARRAPELNENPRQKRYDAPYFVDYVKRLLVFHPRFRFLGDSPEERSESLFTGGFQIHTTLDPEQQKAAERAIDQVLTKKADPHGSLVAMDPRNGKVKAMVGGRDFFAAGKNKKFSKLNLAITARPRVGRSGEADAAPGSGRQAGSAFKPFALAAALEEGIPLTKTYHAPACETFPKANDGEPWKVCNYGSSGYGRVDLTEATVKSINVAYARLVLDLGPKRVTEMARRLGIRTPLRPVNSGALGTNPVNPLGMATAYGTLANNGKRPTPVAITKVVGPTGKRLFKHEKKMPRKVDAAVAYAVNDTLKGVIREGTGTAARLERPAAGKTGTAQEYRDAWFVGSVPQLTAAVWVGYPEASVEMKTSCGSKRRTECRPTRIQVSGGTWPAEIWRVFMERALKGVPVKDFKKPKRGLDEVVIDTRTGCRATAKTPPRHKKKVLRLEENGPSAARCKRLRERLQEEKDKDEAEKQSTDEDAANSKKQKKKRSRSDAATQDDSSGQSSSGGNSNEEGSGGEPDPLPDEEPSPKPDPSPQEEPSPKPEPSPEPSQSPSPEPSPTPDAEPSPSPEPT